jgi:hypothetical protein
VTYDAILNAICVVYYYGVIKQCDIMLNVILVCVAMLSVNILFLVILKAIIICVGMMNVIIIFAIMLSVSYIYKSSVRLTVIIVC